MPHPEELMLELQHPAEECTNATCLVDPGHEPDDFGPLDNMPYLKISGPINSHLSDMEEDVGSSIGIHSLWPRKGRLSERDVVFGLKTSVGLGGYLVSWDLEGMLSRLCGEQVLMVNCTSAYDVYGKLVHLRILVPQIRQMNVRLGGSVRGAMPA